MNSFLVNVPIFYPLKTPGNQKATAGNQKASGVFREKWLNKIYNAKMSIFLENFIVTMLF